MEDIMSKRMKTLVHFIAKILSLRMEHIEETELLLDLRKEFSDVIYFPRDKLTPINNHPLSKFNAPLLVMSLKVGAFRKINSQTTIRISFLKFNISFVN